MELGRSALKRSNVNILAKAIHPRHGLVWSDGKTIYLGSIDFSGDELQNSPSTRLGEFNNVESVYWSNDIDEETCFMSVVHQNNVTVWKVSGSKPKLSFKQVRKITVKPISQGVLWNPKCDILSLFSRNQVCFYFNHLTKKGSYAFPPLVSGKITCGCWSNDGNKLLVCVGSSLLIYTWPNIENSLSDFMPSAWTLPKSDGNVTAIVPINTIKYVCCVDLPLERLCQNTDEYLISEFPFSQTKSDSNRGELIEKHKSKSVKGHLLNLPRNPKAIENDSSQLIYFQINDDARSSVHLNTVSLQCLVSPDLLLYEKCGCVIVGSNSLPCLQVFTITDSNLIQTGEINLEKNERPKGIECISGSKHGVLILVGQPEKQSDVFPSSTTDSYYQLLIRFFPVKPDRSLQHSQSHSGIIQEKHSTSTKKPKGVSESNLRTVQVTDINVNEPHHNDRISLQLTRNTIPSSNTLISNTDGSQTSNKTLETYQTDFRDSVPKFENAEFINVSNKVSTSRVTEDSKDVIRILYNGSDSEGKCDVETKERKADIDNNVQNKESKITSLEDSLSDPGLASSSITGSISSDGNYEFLENLVESQKEQLEELQKKVQCLTQLVDDSSVVNLTKYQTPEKPDFVKISCLYESGSSVTKSFLLDNGRLQLDSLKRAFKLNYIELLLDDEPLILGANIDGYIPLKFTPGSTLKIFGENKSGDLISTNEEVCNLVRKDPQTGATKC